MASVSIIIAAYNAAGFIERALASVMSQTLKPLEIIVVDDCSSDDTRDVVLRHKSNVLSLRLIQLPANSGPSCARNAGIDAAQGDWIAILDADDAWKPDRLERLMTAAVASGADFIADNQVFYDMDAAQETRIGFEAEWQQRTLDALDLFENDMADRSPLGFGILKPILRREFLLEKRVRYNEETRYGEDFLLVAELLFNGGKAVLVNYPGYIYSQRHGAVSKKASTASRSIPRFDLLVAGSDQLSLKYADRIDGDMRKALAIRRRYLWAIHLSNVAREHRVAGRFVRYALSVLGNPDVLKLLLARVVRRLPFLNQPPSLRLAGNAGLGNRK